MNKRKVYEIRGLHCANCAAKIEEELNSLYYIKQASVNPVTSKVIIHLGQDVDEESMYMDVKRIAESIENGVQVMREDAHSGRIFNSHTHNEDDGDNNYASNNDKIFLLRMIAGLTFTVAALFNVRELSLALFLIAYVIVGGDILSIAFRNIIKGRVFDENFLMSIATIGAFIIGEFPEAIGVMMFYQIGEYLQKVAVGKSRASISALMNIRPDHANLKKDDGRIERVAPEEIYPDDVIVIKPGERIPLDGFVIKGESMVDTSNLTGESLPRTVRERDTVLAGTINTTGLLEVRVTTSYKESTVSKILELVENASSKKAPAERFITRFARVYTPIVVILAVAVAVIPPVFMGGSFLTWIYRALSFLVVSCPCALVISVPLSYFAGIGGASKNGVLIKGGNYIEALSKAGTVVFDKTGTLTEGTFEVTKVNSFGIIDEDMLLEYAAYAEAYSDHPIARSIIDAYKKSTNMPILDKSRIKSFEEIPGKGVKIYLGDRYIYAGNYRLMEQLEIKFPRFNEVGTLIHVAVNDNYAGTILISDRVKRTSPAAIDTLRKSGVRKIVMLTGDNSVIADYVGQVLKIDEVYADLLPQGKVKKLEEINTKRYGRGSTIFVGDGINDAPVLARADIGIAMGGVGSDAAIEASDVVIMTDDPSQIATAITIARKTQRIVYENIAFSMAVKALVLVLTTLGITNMWMAVFADVGVTIMAVLNSIRALKN